MLGLHAKDDGTILSAPKWWQPRSTELLQEHVDVVGWDQLIVVVNLFGDLLIHCALQLI